MSDSSANDYDDHGTLKCAVNAELTESLAAEVLQYVPGLYWLRISGKPLPKQALPMLRETLKANASLTCLYVENSPQRK